MIKDENGTKKIKRKERKLWPRTKLRKVISRHKKKNTELITKVYTEVVLQALFCPKFEIIMSIRDIIE